MLAEGDGAGTGDGVAQILNSRSSKGTLLQVDSEAMESAEVEHMAEMLLMRGQRVGENQYIVKINKSKWKINKDPVHHPLEGLGSIPEAEREVEKLEEAKGSNDGSLRNISWPHGNMEITFLEKSAMVGRGYQSGTVAVLSRRKCPQGLQVPSGLGTM